jgi:hypothetical protein
VSPEEKIALAGAIVVALTFITVVAKVFMRRAPLRVKKTKFQKQWHELQKFCKDKSTWPQALTTADQLLDKALLKKGFKGKNMGERLVSAQRKFTDNDSLWFGHKLARKIEENPNLKLKEKDVKDALLGIGQALKDLKAL